MSTALGAIHHSGSKSVSGIKAPSPSGAPSLSSVWRVAGYYTQHGMLTLVLRDGSGQFRYVLNPPNIRIAGLAIDAVLDNQLLTTYSGEPPHQSKEIIKP